MYFHNFGVICQISRIRMFVSDELMKWWNNFCSLKFDFSLKLLPSGELLRNFCSFKAHFVFFQIFIIICQISRFRMFVSHEFASLRPADFVGRTKCPKNFFCWNLIFSMQLSPSGQLLWNSRHFKGYDVFFHIFSIICRISKIWKTEIPKVGKSENPKNPKF